MSDTTGNMDDRAAEARQGLAGNGSAEVCAQPSVPALRFDWTDWLPYLEDQDIPEEQKREIIETLWSIVVAFVDLGWQLNPRPEFCGQPLDLKAILEAVDQGQTKEAE